MGLAVGCFVLSAPVERQALAKVSGRSCVARLAKMNGAGRRACVRRLRRAVKPGAAVLSDLRRLFASADGGTDHRVIAAALDVVRAYGPKARGLAEPLSALLPHQAKVYRGRDKLPVMRVRSYVFLVLSEVGLPESALPMLVDTLGHVDERQSAVELGAAARAAGTLGPRGRGLVPYLLSTLGERFAEEEFSLDRYDPTFPRREATTVQIEVAHALGRICSRLDTEAIAVLRAFSSEGGAPQLDLRLVVAARAALRTIAARAPSPDKSSPPRKGGGR